MASSSNIQRRLRTKKHKSTYRYDCLSLEFNGFVHCRISFSGFIKNKKNFFIELGAWQWETGSPGQASHTTEGEGQPRAHLLSDGPHVGHPCWLPVYETISVPGMIWTVLLQLKFQSNDLDPDYMDVYYLGTLCTFPWCKCQWNIVSNWVLLLNFALITESIGGHCEYLLTRNEAMHFQAHPIVTIFLHNNNNNV